MFLLLLLVPALLCTTHLLQATSRALWLVQLGARMALAALSGPRKKGSGLHRDFQLVSICLDDAEDHSVWSERIIEKDRTAS